MALPSHSALYRRVPWSRDRRRGPWRQRQTTIQIPKKHADRGPRVALHEMPSAETPEIAGASQHRLTLSFMGAPLGLLDLEGGDPAVVRAQ